MTYNLSVNISLVICDIDGTLVKPKSGGDFRKSADDWQWLPGRLEELQRLKAEGKSIRFATNQGGVAFEYLDERDVHNEFLRMVREIGYPPGHNIVHVCFTHPKAKLVGYREDSPRRKPGPGMLLEAMRQEDVTPEQTLMVGDRPEDQQAAAAAKVDFVWAWQFFGDEPPSA
jgi:D-glycero-D-manno-heptose 1,7-bisphosphate phosphatase